MTRRPTKRTAEAVLRAAAEAVQREQVLPHCPRCAAPCCELQTLVLEFSWRQLRLLWGIRKPRKEFDALLARGKGPPEVRTQDGMYFVHKKPCPAFREGRCAVYGSDLKPSGCDDFPVYPDGAGGLVADLRCEALRVEAVAAALRARLPPGTPLRRRPDPEFPFLVTLRVGRGRR